MWIDAGVVGRVKLKLNLRREREIRDAGGRGVGRRYTPHLPGIDFELMSTSGILEYSMFKTLYPSSIPS